MLFVIPLYLSTGNTEFRQGRRRRLDSRGKLYMQLHLEWQRSIRSDCTIWYFDKCDEMMALIDLIPSGKFTWPLVIAPRTERVTKICFRIA
jgi:hypothetical protein